MLWKQQPLMRFEPIEVLSTSIVVESIEKDLFQQTASDKMQLFQWCQRSQIKNSKRPDDDCQIEREHPTNVLIHWSSVENPSEPSPSLLSYYPVFPINLAPQWFFSVVFFHAKSSPTSKRFSTFAESFPLLVQRRHHRGGYLKITPGTSSPNDEVYHCRHFAAND